MKRTKIIYPPSNNDIDISNNTIIDISISSFNKYSYNNVPNNNVSNNHSRINNDIVRYRHYPGRTGGDLSTKDLFRTDELGDLRKPDNIKIPSRPYTRSRVGRDELLNNRIGTLSPYNVTYPPTKPLYGYHSNGITRPYQSILPPVRRENISYLKKEFIKIDMEIDTLDDIILMIDLYPEMDHIEYNIDMCSLHKIRTELVTLNNMVGIDKLKSSILDQIIYYIQDFHKENSGENDYMHTVIYGPPGTGKTEIAKLMGSIFSKLGMLKSGKFRKVTRGDLIAGYLGQTALKTHSVIKETLGGVLFIDEAYALGNEDGNDSFAKECIDTLCEGLSNYKDSIMVIIAGYEDELKKCFFDYNQGLESRFVWRFKTEGFNSKELRLIFIKKIYDANWSFVDDNIIGWDWFEERKGSFKSYGRDIETLFAKTKVCHSRRIFGRKVQDKTRLTLGDINNGYELYLSNEYEEEDKKLSGDIRNWYI